MKIPVLPISYGDALPLLKTIGGQVVPESWRGALPITYHVGPGPATVRLKVVSDWNIRTLYNVVARIAGSDYPDEWVIRGNHHDAWVNGAWDPVSGMSYDSFAWYTRFSDTTFEYSRTLAQAAGTAVMRLANARILPFEFTNFAETINGYVDEIAKLPKQDPKQDVDVAPYRGK